MVCLMRVKELAEASGTSVRSLHHYEHVGLLRPARASNGYRLFSADDVRRVELIRTLQGVGFSLAEIRELAPWWRDDRTPHDRPIAELHVMFQSKLTEIDRHVAQLTSVRTELARRLADLDPTPTTEMGAH
jgi:DNA-binding transcriptional MerR regulator